MKTNKTILVLLSICVIIVLAFYIFNFVKITEEEYASSDDIDVTQRDPEELIVQVDELEKTLEELETKIDEIIKLHQELETRQQLEDLLVDIIMTEGYPEPTEEFARELSKLVISISKEYEETYGFENDIAKLMSIIRVESEFNPNCKSSAGAKGLMQLMDATGQAYAEKLGFKEYKPYDPEQNIRVAWYYYNVNKEKMGEDNAIVAYNQGYRNLTKAVQVSRGNPRSYLNKIKTHNDRYSIKLEEVLP